MIGNDNERRQLAVATFPLEPCNQLMSIYIVRPLLKDQRVRQCFSLAAHDSEQLFASFRHLRTPAEGARHGDQPPRRVTAWLGDENS